MTTIDNLSRREFLTVGAIAGGGLTLGVSLPARRPWAAARESFEPNAFVRIDPDGTVSIWVSQSEMGQGVRTSLPMLVAEELECDWSQVQVIQADAHPERYGQMLTGGSSAVRGRYDSLRTAGAAAREMLVRAAAEQWGVDAGSCRAENSEVIHAASGRRLGYGALATAAAALPVPEKPKLKSDDQLRLLGKPMPRTDTPLKVNGTAEFGIDVRVPDMLFASVVHCPVFGGTLKGFDASKAQAVPGVREVVQVSQGVAVVADYTWAAFKGARALDITWDNGSFDESSSDITRYLDDLCSREGVVARDDGDAPAALNQAAQRVEATYEVPYLAHSTMEPMNCTADVRAGQCEIWAPTQDPQAAMQRAAQLTGLPPEKVTVHTTFLGGGFGRRAEQDFLTDAVETSMKVGAPVQIVWTREEDTQHDYYRPATYNKFNAGLDASGRPTAWTHRIAGGSILERFFGGQPLPNNIDFASVEGATNIPYGIPNVRVEWCKADSPVPLGWWRSVGSSQNAFITESFIDELAHAADADPVEYRRALMAEHPRHRRVLEVAASQAGWGTPLPRGRARGIAVAESFGSFVAEVAEVALEGDEVKVHRVVCAVDCGKIVNPDTIKAQMEGAIVYGLTAALTGEITIERGRVVQSNFHDYPALRMSQMPEVEVHIVESTESPGGVGEPGTPPIAPAVTNALYALTGVRIRKLPIRADRLASQASGRGG